MCCYIVFVCVSMSMCVCVVLVVFCIDFVEQLTITISPII